MDKIDLYEPYRSFDWRAERALQLVDTYKQRGALQLHDDVFIRKYAGILNSIKHTDVRKLTTKFNREQLTIYNAHRFKDQPDGFSKHLIEAYILAGCSNNQIAEYFNITPDGAGWYEKLFFDVRSRLSKPMFILPRVFDITLNGAQNLAYNSQERGIGLVGAGAVSAIIKLFGYYGGPMVIEMLYTGLLRGPMPLTADATKAYLNEALISCLRAKGLMAIRAVDINKFNIQGLVDSAVSAVRENQLEGNLTVMQNVQQFIEATQHHSGAPSLSMPANSPATEYMLTSVEPRAADLLSLAKGEIPFELKNLVEAEFSRVE